MESEARSSFVSKFTKQGHKGVNVEQCKLFVSQINIFIAGSPGGIIHCECSLQRVLEIKCPYKCNGNDPNITKLEFLKTVNGKLSLKKNHKYCSQIQTQMALTNLKSPIFVVYSRGGLF